LPQISVSSGGCASQIRLTTVKTNRFWAEWDFPGPVVGPWSNSIPDPQTAFNGPG
jgi:hypothetical protein